MYCVLSVLLCCCRFTRYLRRIMCNRVRMFCEDKLLKQCRTLYIFISGTLTCCSLPLLRVSVRFASMRGSLSYLIFACRCFPYVNLVCRLPPVPQVAARAVWTPPKARGLNRHMQVCAFIFIAQCSAFPLLVEIRRMLLRFKFCL